MTSTRHTDATRPLSRRALLRGLGMLSISALAAACHPGQIGRAHV